jgi:hypothetical protein
LAAHKAALEKTIYLSGLKQNDYTFYCIKLFDDGIPQVIIVDSKLVFEIKD